MELLKSAKSAKGWFVWTSCVMIVVFLALTVQSFFYVANASPPATDEVVAGKHVLQNNNCMDCHTIFGDGAYYAADLTKVFSVRGAGFVRTLLENPPKITGELWPGEYKRIMPNLNLTTQDIDELLIFLEWISKLNTEGWPPGVETTSLKDTTEQEESNSPVALIKKLNCGTCHTIKTNGLNTVGIIGPVLSNESVRKRGVDWLSRQIGDPKSIPNSEVTKGFEGKQVLMPVFKDQLTKNQLKVLATFINNLKEM